jgi:hypothetical protein
MIAVTLRQLSVGGLSSNNREGIIKSTWSDSMASRIWDKIFLDERKVTFTLHFEYVHIMSMYRNAKFYSL